MPASPGPVPPTTARFAFVDGLRGLAALAVVFPHAVGLLTVPGAPAVARVAGVLAGLGQLGVEVFFALSGFVIAYALRGERLDAAGVGRFVLRRAVRLDPAYWVGLAASVGFVLLRHAVSPGAAPLPTPAQLVAHLFYLQDVLGLGQVNVAFWTLCIEFQFYVAFAGALLVLQRAEARRTGALGRGAVALLLLGLAWPLAAVDVPGARVTLLPHAHLFLAGAVAWWALEGRVARRTWWLALAALWGVGLLRLQPGTLTAAATVTLLYAVGRREALGRVLAARPWQELGRLSYCLYLVHVPVAGCVLALRERLAPGSLLVGAALLPGVYVASLAAARALHVWVERPCLGWAARLKRAPPVAVPAQLVA